MGVGYLNRFQGYLLPYTYTGTVQDMSNVMSRVGHTSSKHCLSVCPLHPWSSLSSKGVKTDGHTQGYNNPPVLRRLVGESHIPPGLSPAYTRSSENMPKFSLPVRPHGRSGPTYTGPLAEPSGQILEILSLPVCPVQQFMSDRFTNSHRKAISPRPTS